MGIAIAPFRHTPLGATVFVIALCCVRVSAHAQTAERSAADWKPAAGPLATRWAKDVNASSPHAEYPRPQMVRKDWLSLNGLWEYAIASKQAERPAKFDGWILVPYPIESALSGVMKRVGPDERLWYRRAFSLPSDRGDKRFLLHFGAVDWETQVWVNGKSVGSHRGGYDPFTLDITDSLSAGDHQEVVVLVSDPTDGSTQPRGKQIRNPNSIWYTPTTGIWQSVWVEPVPATFIDRLKLVPDLDRSELVASITVTGARAGDEIALSSPGAKMRQDSMSRFPGGQSASVAGRPGEEIHLKVPVVHGWTPDEPWLYPLRAELRRDGKAIDAVDSYFGMRKISLGKDGDGITRMLLNNKFVFQYGPLDQGFWPDGLYTAPTDEALKYDIEVTKQLGFNMARKHVKVEPDRWYYWCDTLGLLVWQDMPSGDTYIRESDPDIQRSPDSVAQFELEWSAIMRATFNHPSIVMWVPFNEGWGQFDTARIVEFTRKQDSTRLVNNASGWTDRRVGDVHDIHVYPGPGMPQPEERRAVVLGEYGGLGLPIEGHTWQDKKNWGYRTFESSTALTDAFIQLARQLHPLIGQGLSAAVYTQTTDVEIEVNGLLSYDRAMIKMDADKITAANRKLYTSPPIVRTVIPTSQQEPQDWRFTLEKPGDHWAEPSFDDSKWAVAPGGFGTEGTPGTRVRTRWSTPDIWIRRTLKLDSVPSSPWLVIHHDEDAEVYLNGKPAFRVQGYTTNYVSIPLSAQAAGLLRVGDNTIAVHCRQTGGGQYIDVGLAEEKDSRRN
jgi:hypothetical protein